MRAFLAGTSLFFGLCVAAGAQAAEWRDVEQIFDRPALRDGDVRKFSFPRTDLEVELEGISLRPAMALGSWLAFKGVDANNSVVMGDLVLLESEIAPVISALLRHEQIRVTALHNHLVGAAPSPMYMHVEGHGDAVELASALRAAMAESATPLEPENEAPLEPAGLDIQAITDALGVEGDIGAGVYKISMPLAASVKMDGHIIPPTMGAAHVITFQSIGQGAAAVTGDFVLTGSEVRPVMAAFREHDIMVTALHNHMIGEEPRLYFMHFWGTGPARELAQAVDAALGHAEAAAAEK